MRTIPVDFDFANAARRAAGASGPPQQETEGDDLAKILRSDRPIGAGEKEMLAQLVTGQLGRPSGRSKKEAGHPEVQKAVSKYRKLRAGGAAEKFAASMIAEEFDLSMSTVREYDRSTRDREKALAPFVGIPKK